MHSTHSPTASAGGRWCRKAPKGESFRRQLFSVFPRAKGAVVWLYQKRRPYMIVKAAHRRPEGLVSRLKSDGSPLTSDCLNISNYVKPQISKTSPFGTAYHLSPRESVSHDSQVASAPLRIVFVCHPASGGTIYRGNPQISNLLSQLCHFNSIKNGVKFFNSTC